MAIQADLAGLIDALASAIDAHADELTELDSRIGDGDHGVNMQRGFAAVRERAAELGAMPPAAAATEIGKILMKTVGGSTGVLLGTFGLTFGRELGAARDAAAVAAAFAAAVAAMQRRGKAELGQKTMMDVLLPIAEAFSADPASWPELGARARELAAATAALEASKGRASFLGERSAGVADPGATSCAILLATICSQLSQQQAKKEE